MNVWMTDNEYGQSIAVVWDNGVWGFMDGWHHFPDWEYPLREPTSIYEISIMAKLANK